MPKGVFRRVVLLGQYAFKLPRWQQFAAGMRSNRWEREMWQRWRPRFQWSTLCPVIYADPFGLLVVMPRAVQPVPQDQVDALPDYYPDITAETKHEDFGLLGGSIVALDYGLPFEDAVLERRNYYQGFTGGPAAEFPR
jgi:hypothetical protein